jgi:hypothetical protein
MRRVMSWDYASSDTRLRRKNAFYDPTLSHNTRKDGAPRDYFFSLTQANRELEWGTHAQCEQDRS